VTQAAPDGVRRVAVVVADASAAAAAPPGVDGRRFALAMCEDVVELVGDLSIVDVAVLTVPRGDPGWTAAVSDLCWPGTQVAECAAGDPPSVAQAGFALAASAGAQAAALVAADVPDLPGLLLGKLFRAVGSGPLAVCACASGALVAVATRLPAAAWVAQGLSLEADDGVSRLVAAAPAQTVVARGPSWHRLRHPDDVRLLDPGLEGWAVTRALLSAPLRHDAPATGASGAQ
jgi:hypothetical protein